MAVELPTASHLPDHFREALARRYPDCVLYLHLDPRYGLAVELRRGDLRWMELFETVRYSQNELPIALIRRLDAIEHMLYHNSLPTGATPSVP